MSNRDPYESLGLPALSDELEAVLVVPPSRGGSRPLVPAVALMAVALGALVLRSSVPDWKGIGARPLIARRPQRAYSAKPPPPATSKSRTRAAKLDAMAEITREAQRKRLEQGELKRLKEKAADALADAPHRTVPFHLLATPVQRRLHAEALARERRIIDQFLSEARERHERMFHEAIARHLRFHRESVQRFAGRRPGTPFDGMVDFPRDLPARLPEDFVGHPGERFLQERGTFLLPDGGQEEWTSTTIIMEELDDQSLHNALGH